MSNTPPQFRVPVVGSMNLVSINQLIVLVKPVLNGKNTTTSMAGLHHMAQMQLMPMRDTLQVKPVALEVEVCVGVMAATATPLQDQSNSRKHAQGRRQLVSVVHWKV